MTGPDLPTTSDELLVAALARGDKQALAVLYHRHSTFVHRVAWRTLGDGEAARDVTQSVFEGLIDGARHFRPQARFTTWLHRVVVNRCLHHLERAEHRLREGGHDDAALERRPAPEAASPERLLAGKELGAAIERALADLPPRQRLAIVLADVEGLDQRGLAAALETSEGAVESLLVRARQRLRATLGALRAEWRRP
ncbi:sigma-70 family RNA polymerase sigma factor [Myxococcota bacterium]|nr:sigma-70 family RNA polymerase sigma factor [Myxococcota bacterium]